MFFPTAEFRNQDRVEYVEKQKQRQELKRQQEEAIAAAATKEAAERPPGEKAAERLSWARDELNKIQPGNPYAMDQTWKIIGGTPTEDVEKELTVSLNCGACETFGGYVLSLLGSVPEDGTTVSVETDELSVEVTEIKDHRIEKTIVHKKDKITGNEESETNDI